MNKLLLYLFVVINIIFLSSCSQSVENKTSEQMCVEAQMKLFDKAEKGSKQREYFNTAFHRQTMRPRRHHLSVYRTSLAFLTVY